MPSTHRLVWSWIGFAFILSTCSIGCGPNQQLVKPKTPGQYKAFAIVTGWFLGSSEGRGGADASTPPPLLVVGEQVGDGAHPGTGAAYIYQQSGNQWNSVATLFDPNGTGEQNFGTSMSSRGNDLLIGAPSASNKGKAFVFTRSGTTWSLQATLSATNGQAFDRFGQTLAIDGDWALVGAPFENQAAPAAGAAYTFKRTGTTWAQTQKLITSTPKDHSLFGQSVILDGTEALISSSGDVIPFPPSGGRLHRWTLSGGNWTEGTILRPGDPANGKAFGQSLARQGTWLVVGAPGDNQTAQAAGAVYVFERVGTDWIERQKLLADDGKAQDHFGWNVAIDGDRIVVGAKDATGRVAETGAAYVFEWDGTWKQAWKLTASDGMADDGFGWTCAVNDNLVTVGAPYATIDGFEFAGKGYVYTIVEIPGSQRVITEAKQLVFGK